MCLSKHCHSFIAISHMGTGATPAVVSVPLDVMAPPAQIQREAQHQQQAGAALPSVPPSALLQRAIDEVDLQQLAFGRQIGEGGFGRVRKLCGIAYHTAVIWQG